MPRVRAAAAAAFAGAAAWLSQGSLGFASPDGGRLGLLPISVAALLLVVCAFCFVALMARRGASLAPSALLVLPILPWLPIPLPTVLMVWGGRMALIVWVAFGVGLIASRPFPLRFSFRGARAAGVLALIVYGLAAWHTAPTRPGGDEPHYLVITQSLLQDGDLKIENQHQARDYRAYFGGDLRPDFVRRGRDGNIYSIHAPGIPIAVAPAFAIGGYPAVVILLVCLAALGSALAWHLSWLATDRVDAAWFGWAAATLSTTAIFQAPSVYPDGPGALLVLTGIWALVRAGREVETGSARALPWLLHGAALALLPWLHTRFAILAGTIGALALLRLSMTKEPAAKAVAFLAVPAVSAMAWIGYFIAIYGTPDPSAPYGATEIGSFAHVPSGLSGILFDQRFGLLAYAPVLACGFGGLVAMLRRVTHRRLALELLFVAVPYMLAFSVYAMWWGGSSAPARFLMPVVPALAIPAAAAWAAMDRRGTRAAAVAALVFSLLVAAIVVTVANGRLAFNGRDGFAQWLEWLAPGLDLPLGVPVWFRGHPVFARLAGDAVYLQSVAVWIAAMGAAWLLVRRLGEHGRLRDRGALAAVTAATFAAAAMLATTILWTLHGADGIEAGEAQLGLLRRIAGERRYVALALDPPSRIAADRLGAAMRIESRPGAARGCAGRNDRPIFSLPALPAGRYRLRIRAQAASGLLLIGIGCDQYSIRTEPLAAPPAPIELDFPVNIRRLMIRGDEAARHSARSLVVEPVSLVPAARRLAAGDARHGVRYGDATVYFMDEGLFAEPEAFWVGGAREGMLVVQPDAPRPSAALLLRNAPVDNQLRIETTAWRDDLRLAPGEQRRIEVPLDTSRGATLIRFTAASGFRPADGDPRSRDTRLLGVWVKVE